MRKSLLLLGALAVTYVGSASASPALDAWEKCSPIVKQFAKDRLEAYTKANADKIETSSLLDTFSIEVVSKAPIAFESRTGYEIESKTVKSNSTTTKQVLINEMVIRSSLSPDRKSCLIVESK